MVASRKVFGLGICALGWSSTQKVYPDEVAARGRGQIEARPSFDELSPNKIIREREPLGTVAQLADFATSAEAARR